MEFKIGKRDKQKAEQKLNIMNAFLSEMEMTALHDIKIESICHRLGISKVTFFNYFSSKEQVVEYFILLWQFKLSYKLDQSRVSNKEKLYMIFDYVCEHPAAINIMNALMMFFIKIDCYQPIDITDYELYMFDDKAYLMGYKPLMIKTMFEAYSESKNQAKVLLSGFYGIPFLAGVYRENLRQSFDSFLLELIGGRDE
jgi:hypothetical protein